MPCGLPQDRGESPRLRLNPADRKLLDNLCFMRLFIFFSGRFLFVWVSVGNYNYELKLPRKFLALLCAARRTRHSGAKESRNCANSTASMTQHAHTVLARTVT